LALAASALALTRALAFVTVLVHVTVKCDVAGGPLGEPALAPSVRNRERAFEHVSSFDHL